MRSVDTTEQQTKGMRTDLVLERMRLHAYYEGMRRALLIQYFETVFEFMYELANYPANKGLGVTPSQIKAFTKLSREIKNFGKNITFDGEGNRWASEFEQPAIPGIRRVVKNSVWKHVVGQLVLTAKESAAVLQDKFIGIKNELAQAQNFLLDLISRQPPTWQDSISNRSISNLLPGAPSLQAAPIE